MENENNIIIIENGPSTEGPKKPEMSTAVAIIVAGALIMIGMIVSRGGGTTAQPSAPKTLSEQVGVSREAIQECIAGIDANALLDRIDKSVDLAMSHIPRDDRGTPYSVIIGPGGIKTEIRGAQSYVNVKKAIDNLRKGIVTEPYKGSINPSEEGDHIKGNANASITVIEYSDFECPYCKQFHPTMEQIVKESSDVRWIYRHYPIHQHSFAMLIAADCVGKLKGEDAFWKYSDLLFGLMETKEDSVSGKL